MSLSISIVSFNTTDLLKKCLADIFSQTYNGKLEVYVVDNNSQDGSVKMLEENFKGRIKLIKNSTNIGFAKAQNQALRLFESDYIMLLNPDTKIPADALVKIEEFMDSRPYCAIASCRITDSNKKLQSNGGNFPTGLALLSWLFNLESFGILQNFHRQDKKYYDHAHQVDWVGGTFMIIRKDAVKKIGFLNEDYFMYFEDVEYCYRATKKGYQIWIDPEVEITHLSGASSKNPRFKQWCGEFWGVIHFYQKTLFKGFAGVFFSIFVRLLIYFSSLLRIGAFILKGKFSYSLTYAKVLVSI